MPIKYIFLYSLKERNSASCSRSCIETTLEMKGFIKELKNYLRSSLFYL